MTRGTIQRHDAVIRRKITFRQMPVCVIIQGIRQAGSLSINETAQKLQGNK